VVEICEGWIECKLGAEDEERLWEKVWGIVGKERVLCWHIWSSHGSLMGPIQVARLLFGSFMRVEGSFMLDEIKL
jgi:hypothetical protein